MVANNKRESALQLILRAGHELSFGQRTELLTLCSDAYHLDYQPFLDSFPGPTHVLAYVDGRLVSHALWITRWLQVGHGPLLRTAYVEAVATDKAYRGRGLATAVMRYLQSQIIDYELGGLAPANYPLYERLGWELWRGPLSIRTTNGLHPTPQAELMILRLPRTPALDLTDPISAEWRSGELW